MSKEDALIKYKTNAKVIGKIFSKEINAKKVDQQEANEDIDSYQEEQLLCTIKLLYAFVNHNISRRKDQ